MIWEKVKLGDVTDSCLGKMLDKNKNKGDYQPYLANINVRWGSFDLENLSKMRFQKDEEKRYGLEYGDLIICEGGEPGRCAIWKNQITNMKIQKALHRVRVGKELDYRYLYYWFLLAGKQNALKQYFTGATIMHLPGDKLKSIVIEKPAFEKQVRIADILSSYDDLIENNQKQIKLLEEAAQRLYKEWFVDFRFPGHENTTFIDGLPEGFQKLTIEKSLEIYIGGGWGKENPTSKNCFEGRVIRGTDINDIKTGKYQNIPLRYHTENDIKTRCLKSNDIVLELSNGNINNIGRTILINEKILRNCGKNTICASFCKLLRPINKNLSIILYLEIQDMQSSGRILPYKKQGSNGINNFAFEDFLKHQVVFTNRMDLLLPLENLINEVENLQQQTTLLIEARDRLLPKLMSGEIEV